MELIEGIDSGILIWIQEQLRTPWLTAFFRVVTALGNAGLVWIALAAALAAVKKTRRAGVCAAVSLAAVFIVNNLALKNIFGRIRPYEVIPGLAALVDKPSDPSFPSGHTAAAFAAAAALIFARAPLRVSVPAAALAVLMGFSRLYLGVHYPSDVLAGAAVGTVTALLVSAAAARLRRRSERGRKRASENGEDRLRGETDK